MCMYVRCPNVDPDWKKKKQFSPFNLVNFAIIASCQLFTNLRFSSIFCSCTPCWFEMRMHRIVLQFLSLNIAHYAIPQAHSFALINRTNTKHFEATLGTKYQFQQKQQQQQRQQTKTESARAREKERENFNPFQIWPMHWNFNLTDTTLRLTSTEKERNFFVLFACAYTEESKTMNYLLLRLLSLKLLFCSRTISKTRNYFLASWFLRSTTFFLVAFTPNSLLCHCFLLYFSPSLIFVHVSTFFLSYLHLLTHSHACQIKCCDWIFSLYFVHTHAQLHRWLYIFGICGWHFTLFRWIFFLQMCAVIENVRALNSIVACKILSLDVEKLKTNSHTLMMFNCLALIVVWSLFDLDMDLGKIAQQSHSASKTVWQPLLS